MILTKETKMGGRPSAASDSVDGSISKSNTLSPKKLATRTVSEPERIRTHHHPVPTTNLSFREGQHTGLSLGVHGALVQGLNLRESPQHRSDSRIYSPQIDGKVRADSPQIQIHAASQN